MKSSQYLRWGAAEPVFAIKISSMPKLDPVPVYIVCIVHECWDKSYGGCSLKYSFPCCPTDSEA